ncbi:MULTISPECIES: hypothetical protein [Acidithiobacillus]|uniref:DUF4160 domain-containing protein n=1 Tax=Acidithiobacillus thiooxidans TaxID=930 RepID=A0A1C2JCN1_ACITH|nr:MULTISPECIES: hypothetical protein [Acidithiobacillus]OCX70734.1 hypothetical protein A6M23_13380 [Acidithiobacillus thiooxidans]OCX85998.1 hypothetical protein A6P08_07070 [Acidithiobacillus thiooxidans]
MTNYSVGDDWRIRINGREQHPLPHVHVQFRDGSRVSLAIETGASSRLCLAPKAIGTGADLD